MPWITPFVSIRCGVSCSDANFKATYQDKHTATEDKSVRRYGLLV